MIFGYGRPKHGAAGPVIQWRHSLWGSETAEAPPKATDIVGGQAETDRKSQPDSKSCGDERDAPPSVASATVNGVENDIEREEAVVELRLPIMPGGS